MKLSDKILSSQTQIAGYRIQPYKAYTDVTAYGLGNISPAVAAPAIADVAYVAAPIGSTVRGKQIVVDRPRPQVISNGAAVSAGNNSPRR